MKEHIFAAIFFIFVAVWVFLSIYSDNIIVRLQISWMPLYQVVLILYSLHNLRVLIRKISQNSSGQHKPINPNNLTINLTIAVYSVRSSLGLALAAVMLAL